jgi:hypothetical protein
VSTDYRTKAEKDAADRFPRDTAKHVMTVLHDDGLYRHLRFSSYPQGWGEFWFDLITWPGCLTIRGDYGSAYTFSRELDMVPFFRGRPGRINAHYWAQKLDGGGEAREYSEDIFRQVVVENFVDAVRYQDAPRGLGKAVRTDILDQDLSNEDEARGLLEEFEYGATFKASCSCGKSESFRTPGDAVRWRSNHIEPGHATHVSKVERVEGFRFHDTWELDFRDYTRTFAWACHAIVWGIARYDRLTRYGLQTLATPKQVAS